MNSGKQKDDDEGRNEMKGFHGDGEVRLNVIIKIIKSAKYNHICTKQSNFMGKNDKWDKTSAPHQRTVAPLRVFNLGCMNSQFSVAFTTF